MDAMAAPRGPIPWAGLGLGAAAFVGLGLIAPPGGLTAEGWFVARVAALMVIWWLTEAIPIPATALLPLVAFPLGAGQTLAQTATPYMNPVVILLMAGFIIAKAIERWNLHTRLALSVLVLVGARPSALLAGFMLATAALSMWISNTATSLMMMPIALSVARALAPAEAAGSKSATAIATALALGTAYAASIGGLATPVGSPTNLIVIGFLAETGIELDFADWMRLGLPVVALLLPLTWAVLAIGLPRAGSNDRARSNAQQVLRTRLAALGPMSAPEARVLALFSVIALLWVFSGAIEQALGLKQLDDSMVAVGGALGFFIAPSGSKTEPNTALLEWASAEKIPWGVVLLFGGGLSLAGAMTSTGLGAVIAQAFGGLAAAPGLVVLIIVTVAVLALTELTSNVATASAIMPVILAMAASTGLDPVASAAPVGMAASCAFMLPMATGPNAVAYAAGGVGIGQMARAGFWVNLAAAAVIVLVVSVLIGSSSP